MAYNRAIMRWHCGISSFALMIVIASLAIGHAGLAQTTLPSGPAGASVAAHLGWGQMMVAGRWNPLLVTVTAPRPRGVIIEISQEDGPANLHRIRQRATAGPIATTYALVCPLATISSHVVVRICDDDTDATLASTVANARADQVAVDPDHDFIAASGSLANWPILHDQLTAAGFETGALQTSRLPYQPIGYDGVSLLMLDAVDFRQFDFSQQSAILRWVSAGGCLLVWPGLEPLPPSSPLVDVLPATFGEVHTFRINGQEFPGRLISPKPASQPLIVNAAMPANNGCIMPYGLGSIAVVPMDLSKLQFNVPADASAFWQPLLASAGIAKLPLQAEPIIPDGYNVSEPNTARQRILDDLQARLPDIPDSMWESLFAMLGAICLLCVVIGPLDSILLFVNHRPPRNWLTLAGWIGAVVCVVALAIGRLPTASRDISLRVIEQSADGVVATAELMAISPGSQTTVNLSNAEHAVAWRTFPAVSPPGTYASDFSILDCQQDQHGTWIDKLSVDAGKNQFAQSEQFSSAPPIITATLNIFAGRGKPTISGSITNHGTLPLQHLRLTTSLGQMDLNTPVPPGQTQNISDVLHKPDPAEPGLFADLHALNESRSRRISRILAGGSMACVEAIQHMQVVRAVLPLEQSPAKF